MNPQTRGGLTPRFFLRTALCALTLPTGIWAQTMPTLEIIGQADSLTQPSLQTAQEQIKTMPGGASVVDLNPVREGRQSTWSDSLGLAPGVFIQDRFGSEEARISMRGSALSRTYHSFGTKVMQDGVPINYADGFFDMQTVDPNASRYVEVLRGPNATVYGATTLGGALNFVSPTGYTSPAWVGRAEAGSFGYVKVFGSTAGVLKTTEAQAPVWDYYVAGSQTQQDGFRDHAAMANDKLIANVGVKVNRDVESRFFAAAVRSRTQLPGYLTYAELQSTPSIANSSRGTGAFASIYPYREANNNRRDVDTQRVANTTTVRDGRTLYEVAAYAMNYSLWHPISSIVQQHAQTQGGHVKLTHMADVHQLTLAWLPSVGTTRGSSAPSNQQGGASGPVTSLYEQASVNQSFFIEDKFRVSSHTTLVGALQYDRANRKVTDTLTTANNSDHTFAQWSPRLGVVHELTPQAQVFASVSQNFEAPLFGLTGTTTAANQAQTGTTFEVGTRGEVTHAGHHLGWDATLYRANLRNEFQSVCAAPGCVTPFTQNVPKTLHQGLELGLTHRFGAAFDSRMALLYSDFRFVDHLVYGNNAMPGFAPLIVRGEALYRFGAEVNGKRAVYAGPKWEWVPRAATMDSTNSLYNPGYTVLGFKAGQALDRTWSWFVDARNVTNKKYAGTTNISANFNGVGPASGAYYPGDGRALYVGIDAKFN